MAGLPWAEAASFAGRAACATFVQVVAVCALFWSVTRYMPGRRIDAHGPSARLARLELAYGGVTVLIMGATLCVVSYLPRGWLQVDAPSPGRLVGELALYLVVYDLGYYWWHRLMHTRALYPVVHRVHHLDHRPTVLAALAFHPLETLGTMSLFVAVAVVLRLHVFSVLAYQGIQLAVTAFAHCGYGILPEGWEHAPGLALTTTPLVHQTHHGRQRCNFGFYTTLWDRVFGTWEPSDVDAFWRARRAEPAGAPVEA